MSSNSDESKDSEENEIISKNEIKKEEEEKKDEKKEVKKKLIENEDSNDDSIDNNDDKNNTGLKKMEYDVPFYSNEIKKVYRITSDIFPVISIIKTDTKKPAPINRCYLTAEFSPKNNSIICIGGCDEKCEQYGKITEYDFAKNVWNHWECDDQTELGFELSGHSSNLIMIKKKGGIVEEYIYVFGGYDNYKNEFSAQSYLLNIKMKNFEKINYNIYDKNQELPLPRTYHTSNYDISENKIYIYGGTDMNINHCKGDNFQALWKFNIIEKTWEKRNLEPKLQDGPPRGHSSIFFEDKLYIFGGVTLFKKFQNSMHIININKNRIETLDYNNEDFKKGCIPEPMAFHSAVLIDDKRILIHGGLDKNYNAINSIYIYYINDMKFDKVNIPLIPNLFGHKVVMNHTKKKLYIVGGFDNFKYVGDENLSYKIEKDEDDIINKNEGKFIFVPMNNLLEISLTRENIGEDFLEGETPTPTGENNTKIRKKWKKLFYSNVN